MAMGGGDHYPGEQYDYHKRQLTERTREKNMDYLTEEGKKEARKLLAQAQIDLNESTDVYDKFVQRGKIIAYRKMLKE